MASPFPGMDPYLESPDWFPNLHDGLITFLVGALMRRLPEPYNDFFVYPIRLEQRLPGVSIPLLPGDADVPLSIQSVFDRAYDEGPYFRVVRYGEAPIIPPLRAEQLEWVKARLQPSA